MRIVFLILILALAAGCQSAATPAPSAKAPAISAAPTVVAQPTAAPASPTTAPAAPAKTTTLRFGVLPITDVLPMYVAEQQGYFKAANLDVQLVPVASAAERDQLLQGNQLDGVLNDLVSTVLFNAEQPRIRIVRKARQAFPDAPQYRLLAAPNSGITGVQQLKGVPVAVSDNSVIAYWAERVMQAEGLAKSDIQTTAVPNIVQRAQLLGQGQLKAGVLPDPLASLAILGGAKVIIDDTKYPQYGQSVISFRTGYLQENPAAVRGFLQAYDKAIGDLRTKPQEFRSLLIEKGRVPEQLQQSFPMPRFPDPGVTTEAEFKDVVDWAMEKGIVKSPVSYASSVDPGYVK